MTRWAVGGRQSHSLVKFSALHCAETEGRSSSTVCNLVATSVNTPVRPVRSCRTVLGYMEKLVLFHQQNQTHTHFYAQRESGATVTQGDFTAMAWKKAKTLSQFSAIVTNVSVLSFFFFTVLFSCVSLTPCLPRCHRRPCCLCCHHRLLHPPPLSL